MKKENGLSILFFVLAILCYTISSYFFLMGNSNMLGLTLMGAGTVGLCIGGIISKKSQK